MVFHPLLIHSRSTLLPRHHGLHELSLLRREFLTAVALRSDFPDPLHVRGPGALRQKPGPRSGLALQKSEQQPCNFLLPCRRGMRAVRTEILPAPNETVATALVSVRPQVRPPSDPRGADRALGRVKGQFGVYTDLTRDDPFHCKTAFIGVWFLIRRAGCVAAVGAARQVSHLQIREPVVKVMQNPDQVRLLRAALGGRCLPLRGGYGR